ncbi:MAG: hypothetical protein A3F77_16605 [Betaproteobacteria bacterium RIFCSPLOWO2_12_FULL_67_28]|nr:MAG: hypothetical protein A3F77_16605 [Betaproteobacteria bacterium RIFCSPLOWO2_12_FULL_67_28]
MTDLSKEQRFSGPPLLVEHGVVSGVSVVVPGKERPWGVLGAHSRTPRRFERREAEFLQAAANLLSAALERCRAHAALRMSEARFRSLTFLSADYYWETDAEMRLSLRSADAEMKSGFATITSLGKRPWEYEDMTPVSCSWEDYRATIGARSPFRDFECRRIDSDGKERYLSISGEPFYDDQGACLGYRGVARVITERKLAERALAEREGLLRATFDHAPDGISVFDVSGRLIKANRALRSMLGYSESEIRQMTLADLVHPDERSESRRLREELIAGKRTRFVSRRRYRCKDGSFLSTRITVSALHAEDGSVRHTIGLIEDVTEQLHAEAKLREMGENLAASEAQLRAFMDYSPLSMFIKDREGRYRHVNAQFLRNFGLTADEVLGRTSTEIFPRAQAQVFLNNDARIRATRAPIMDEENVLFIDGMHATLGNKFPILDDRGEVVAIGGVVADITERKRMEQALRESRQLLARAQAIAGLGYWEFDLATGLTRASRELRGMLGITDDVPPQSPQWALNVIHPEDRERVRAAMQRSIEQGSSYDLETRVVAAGVGERIMRLAGEVAKDDAGRTTKLIGTCLDITAQRRREEALCDAADQLQALSRRLVDAQETERRRLAADLHDRVGQNLTALGINLDILVGTMQGLDANATRRLRDSLALLDQTALCVEGVLDDLRPPMLDDLGLGPALRWVAGEFSRRTDIPARLHVQGTERRIDRQNEIALLRIVQEALNNVVKHARAGQVEITLGWQTDAVRVEVADDGAGFARSESDGRRGFGLVTMRERIQAAGGLLDVQSAAGKGTRVRALVPG